MPAMMTMAYRKLTFATVLLAMGSSVAVAQSSRFVGETADVCTAPSNLTIAVDGSRASHEQMRRALSEYRDWKREILKYIDCLDDKNDEERALNALDSEKHAQRITIYNRLVQALVEATQRMNREVDTYSGKSKS